MSSTCCRTRINGCTRPTGIAPAGTGAVYVIAQATSSNREVFTLAKATATGLDANELHVGLGEKIEEQADRVAAAADAGDDLIGQAL